MHTNFVTQASHNPHFLFLSSAAVFRSHREMYYIMLRNLAHRVCGFEPECTRI